MPVSDTGRIWIATIAGHARVAVDVLGYFARATTAADTTRTGTWRPVPATVAATVDLPAQGSQTVTLPGAPEKNLTGAVLTVNTTGTAAGHVRVTPPGGTTKADAVDVVKGTRSAAVFAASTDGSVTLTNTAAAPTKATLLLSGWITTPQPGGARLQPAATDLGSVKTGKVATLTGKVPADARAAVLAVTTKGGAKGGSVTVWGAGDRPAARSVDVRANRSNTDLVVVALADDRAIRVAGDAPKGTASLRLVGVIR